ncbi:hypothetical protein [Actinoallomurus rhizosphaericola]|uniref:hypothetical protein n=1 Tax=Actinoallomurus rhizosphaericola TaxID=2952536 RepID=UPI0020924A3F|nr:hypothetical protein [Actinoallomurus rhizosphaericola]MCO5996735.1 hypothetical protein [Actinoallomurus rhizosphaericola]
MRKLSMALAGATAVAGLALTAGTAGATTVHTAGGAKCGSKWCATVRGSGLKVDTFNTHLRSYKAFSGYPYVEVEPPHKKVYFLWWNRVKNVHGFDGKLDRKFPNKTVLCFGVAPTKAYQDHPGDACFTVHK